LVPLKPGRTRDGRIAANDLQHRIDVRRLQRQHQESLQQAAFLHKEELDRSEARHLDVLAREHVREQIAVASGVVSEMGGLMLPTSALCEALDDLGRLVGTRPSMELVEEINNSVQTFTTRTEALLVFDSKVVAAEMVTTNDAVFEVLRAIKRQEKVLGDLIQQQQTTILARKQPGDVMGIRTAFGELAKLSEPLRKAVAQNLRPVLLDERSAAAKPTLTD
jgi:hypothetical protein